MMITIRFVWFSRILDLVSRNLIFYFPGKWDYSLDLKSFLFPAKCLCVHVLHYVRVETGGMRAFSPPRSGDELVPFDVSHWLFPQNSIWVPRKLGPTAFFTVEKIHGTRQWAPSVLLSLSRLSENSSKKRARVIFQSRHVNQTIL